MRRRAFRPEVSGCLENRSLLSGMAPPPAGPVVIRFGPLDRYTEHMRMSFAYFGRYREVTRLLNELHDDAEKIPFGRADDLDASIDGIVDQMQHDLAVHAPHPIQTAQNELMSVIRSNILTRVRAGEAVLRPSAPGSWN